MEIIFNYDANKTHFHNKGFALSLVLKVKLFGTRKWPIKLDLELEHSFIQERMANKIDTSEGSFMAELEGMETKRLEAATDYAGRLEDRWAVISVVNLSTRIESRFS